jgi:Flp pilus assembly protein CpaB
VLQRREATVEVLVATSDIAAGATVTESDFDVVDISAADPLLPVLLSQLPAGSVVTSSLTAGEPLLRSDVVVAGAVASGRTFTLEVDRLVVDGLGLAIGDRVDVIGVDADGRVGFVVVDVAVTRLPGTAQGSAFAAAASRSAWVTVAVDEAQALALSGAQRLGAIELVRSTGAGPIDMAVQPTEMLRPVATPSGEPDS